jgi:hypothetical protein
VHSGELSNLGPGEALGIDDFGDRGHSTLGREITYVDAPDDAVRDAPPGFGLDEWFVNALVGLSGLTADPASMAMPARSATPWRGSLDSLRDLSATCSRKWLLS